MRTTITKRYFSQRLNRNGRNVVIVGAKRTPIGSFMGMLSNLNASHLGTCAAKAALAQCELDPKEVEEVYMGCVLQAGVGQAPARQVALGTEMGYDTPSTTVNKVCASGMKSVMMAAQSISLGDRSIMLAGGMESMSKVPHYMYLRRPTGYGNATAIDAIQHDGLTDVYNNILMGSCVEKTTTEVDISRQAQDEFAIKSYERARAAQENGLLDWEIVEITEKDRRG